VTGGTRPEQPHPGPAPGPFVTAPGEGRRISGPTGLPMTVKLPGEATAGAYALIEYAHEPGAPGPLPHVHHRHEEAFHVIEGELTLLVGTETLTLGPGGYAVVPRGTVHQPRNDGAVPVRFFFITSPAMDGFFDGMAELLAATAGSPPAEELRALGARWDCEFVGLPATGDVAFPTEEPGR